MRRVLSIFCILGPRSEVHFYRIDPSPVDLAFSQNNFFAVYVNVRLLKYAENQIKQRMDHEKDTEQNKKRRSNEQK